MDDPTNPASLPTPSVDTAQLDAELAALLAELLAAAQPSEAQREIDTFAMRANTCRDPGLAWRAADASPRLRRVMFHQHPWLRDLFPPQVPPPVDYRSRLRPSRAPRRTRQRSRCRRAARRGVTRAGPDDSDPDEPPEGPPPYPSDGGAA